MLRERVTIDSAVLDRLIRLHGRGEPHITLAQAAVWHDPTTQHVRDRAVLDPFIEFGLATPRGPLPDLADTLAVLSCPTVEYYGWFTHQGETTAVLAAAVDHDAVLAVRRADQVMLAAADAARLAEALLARLPQARPVVGPAINVRRDELRPGAMGSCQDAVARLTSRPTVGGGEFYVAVRNVASGRRRCVPYPIQYHDTIEGRWWLQVVSSHGEEWVVAAPGTNRLLLNRLHEAYRTLTTAPSRYGQLPTIVGDHPPVWTDATTA